MNFRDFAIPLRTDSDLDPLLDAIGNSPCVMIGEASHGTRDYHEWRFRIVKRLITEDNSGPHGWKFIAVEWDWPDCYRINCYVKGFSNENVDDIFRQFKRWPQWMWCHPEAIQFVQWLRNYNMKLPVNQRVGFYGLDLFSLQAALEFIRNYLERHNYNNEVHRLLTLLGSCLTDISNNEQRLTSQCQHEILSTKSNNTYNDTMDIKVLQNMKNSLPRELLNIFNTIQPTSLQTAKEAEDFLSAIMCIQILLDTQEYFNTLEGTNSEAASWNLRDFHMEDTYERLRQFNEETYGNGRCIILGHNTHVGDASFTNMKDSGMINLAQLLREDYGNNYVYLIGFSTYQGSVLAGVDWEGPTRVMRVPPAEEGSWDNFLHQNLGTDSLIIFRSHSCPFSCQDGLKEPNWPYVVKGQRVIGATYNPVYDSYQYVPTQLPYRYDSLIYLENTSAIKPLNFVNLG